MAEQITNPQPKLLPEAPITGASTEETEEEDFIDWKPSVETLPIRERDLPAVMREVVMNAPPSRKIPAFIATLAPLSALATRVRLTYYHDGPIRPHGLLLQVVIEGEQSSGKSFAADIERLIMNDTLKARDKAQRRLEQEYREKKNRRAQNKQLEEQPQTTIRVIPPTISKTVLTKRADFYERILGDTLTFWMFAEELAQVTDAGKAGYSNLRTIMRTAYDLGSLFGIDYASDNSYSAIVDINICSMFCATPSAVDEYFDKKSIEGGNVTRCILCPIESRVENDGETFKMYTEEQMIAIRQTLNRMMADCYDEHDHLRPIMQLDTSWIDRTCKAFIDLKGRDYKLSANEAVKTFRFRSCVSAFRIASLCYYLYSIEMGFDPTNNDPSLVKQRAQRLCRRIFQFMAEYIIENLLKRWGRKFNELNSKRKNEDGSPDKNILYNMLPAEFTRDQLKLLLTQTGCTTPAKQFIYMWGPKDLGLIEIIDKNHFRKKSPSHD
ncbi:MAG: hypothetical protein Q4B58_02765 [Bacteroidales bacterium]|nr:hypothetical protein [Bacteroidales bacterium]